MKIVSVILLSVCLFSCAPQKVNTEVADDVNWSNFRTFDFYNTTASGDTTSAVFNNRVMILKQAIADELQKKGLRQASSNADMLVNIGVVVQEKVQTRNTDFLTDAPRYVGQRRYSWKSQEVEVSRYKQGTITVDLVDNSQNRLVWKGVVEDVLPSKESKVQKSVQESVTRLFQNFPTPLK